MAGPIESKVTAATVGAGAGAVIAAFVLWLLDGLFWGGSMEPDVPVPVSALVTLVVSMVGAYWAGYQARHTFRPDLGDTSMRPDDPSGSHVAS